LFSRFNYLTVLYFYLFLYILIQLFYIPGKLSLPDEIIYWPRDLETIKFVYVFKYDHTFGHPPLFSVLLKVIGFFTSYKINFAQYILLLVNVLSLRFLYDFMTRFQTRLLSLIFVILWSTTPLFFTHISYLVPNTLLTLLVLLSFKYIEDNKNLFFFFLFLAILTRESSLAFLVSFYVIDKERSKRLKEYIFLLSLVPLHFLMTKLFFDDFVMYLGHRDFLSSHPIDFSKEFFKQTSLSF